MDAAAPGVRTGSKLGQAVVRQASPWGTPTASTLEAPRRTAGAVTEQLLEQLTSAVQGAAGNLRRERAEWRREARADADAFLQRLEQELRQVLQEERRHADARSRLHESLLQQHADALAAQLERLRHPRATEATSGCVQQAPQPAAKHEVTQKLELMEDALRRMESAMHVRQKESVGSAVAQAQAPSSCLQQAPQPAGKHELTEKLALVEDVLGRLESTMHSRQRELAGAAAAQLPKKPEGGNPASEWSTRISAGSAQRVDVTEFMHVAKAPEKPEVEDNIPTSDDGGLVLAAKEPSRPCSGEALGGAISAGRGGLPVGDHRAQGGQQAAWEPGPEQDETDPPAIESERPDLGVSKLSALFASAGAADVKPIEKQMSGESDDIIGNARRSSVLGLPVVELDQLRGNPRGAPLRARCADVAIAAMLGLERMRAQGPTRTELARLVSSAAFEALSGLVIVANLIFMVYATDASVASSRGEATSLEMEVSEIVFLSWYSLEVLLKLVAWRRHFFIGDDWSWNLFDLALVLVALYFQLFGFLFVGYGDGANATVLRALRVMRLSKALRAVRLARSLTFFTTVRLILRAVMGSWISLFWSVVALTLGFYVFAILFVQGAATFLKDEGRVLDPALERDVLSWFGSVGRCMLTLFKATFGGQTWDRYYEALALMGNTNAAAFLLFIAFMRIAVFNIFTAIYVEMTARLAAPCTQTQARHKRLREREEAKELRRLVSTMDAERTGRISAAQFSKMVRDAHMRDCFAVLGLDLRNAEHFFEMLGFVSGHSSVDIDAFVEGCLRMKGAATGLAQQSILMEARLLRRAQREAALLMLERLAKLDVSLQKVAREASGASRTFYQGRFSHADV